jgi:hypothetical protein
VKRRCGGSLRKTRCGGSLRDAPHLDGTRGAEEAFRMGGSADVEGGMGAGGGMAAAARQPAAAAASSWKQPCSNGVNTGRFAG